MLCRSRTQNLTVKKGRPLAMLEMNGLPSATTPARQTNREYRVKTWKRNMLHPCRGRLAVARAGERASFAKSKRSLRSLAPAFETWDILGICFGCQKQFTPWRLGPCAAAAPPLSLIQTGAVVVA